MLITAPIRKRVVSSVQLNCFSLPLPCGVVDIFFVALQRFQEMDGNAKKFTLPLFGQLGRASSAQQMGPGGQHHVLSSSFSNPTSVQDLSISPPVSPSKPPLMPQLSRRQRRASLVKLSLSNFLPPSPLSVSLSLSPLILLSILIYLYLQP